MIVREVVSGGFLDITNAPTPSAYDAYQLSEVYGYYSAGSLTSGPDSGTGVNNYDNSQNSQGGRVGETLHHGLQHQRLRDYRGGHRGGQQ